MANGRARLHNWVIDRHQDATAPTRDPVTGGRGALISVTIERCPVASAQRDADGKSTLARRNRKQSRSLE